MRATTRAIILATALCQFLVLPASSNAAIIYGDTTTEASFAASTTKQVGDIVNDVVTGDLGAESTSDAKGILSGIGSFFAGVNTWLKDTAGIDFFGILKGIGHFFLVVIQFLVDLLRKVL